MKVHEQQAMHVPGFPHISINKSKALWLAGAIVIGLTMLAMVDGQQPVYEGSGTAPAIGAAAFEYFPAQFVNQAKGPAEDHVPTF
jgi:hypothetical protein